MTGLHFQLRNVCLIIVALLATLHQTTSDFSFSNRRNCGSAINDALRLMCGDGGFNTYRNDGKRSLPSEDDKDLIDDVIDDKSLALNELNGLQFWKNMADDSLSLAKLRRRRNQGIVYECCLKPCTTRELLTYCRRN